MSRDQWKVVNQTPGVSRSSLIAKLADDSLIQSKRRQAGNILENVNKIFDHVTTDPRLISNDQSDIKYVLFFTSRWHYPCGGLKFYTSKELLGTLKSENLLKKRW